MEYVVDLFVINFNIVKILKVIIKTNTINIYL